MSTYTESLGLELITPGSQAGLWGNTTNNTFTLIDQAITGVTPISFASASGTTYTLTDYNGAEDEARAAVLNITGTATGSNTVVIPNKQKTYLVRNNTGQDVVFRTTTPAATYTVGAGYSILIFCDGNNNVFTGIAAPSVGTLLVNAGGTGQTTFTAGFVKSPGGTSALTSAATVSLSSEVSGTLPVSNGGTGVISLANNGLMIGKGTGAVESLLGGASGQVATWNGSAWTAATPASAGVTSVFGRTGAVVAQSSDYSTFYLGLTATAANSSQLGGVAASGYLTTSGTAADSDKLGGVAASSYMLKSGGTFTGSVAMGSGAQFSIGSGASILSQSYNMTTTTSMYNIGTQIIWAISTATAMYIDVAGNFRIYGSAAGKVGGGTWYDTSDERLKENIAPLTGALAKISALNPVSYEWKYDRADVSNVGFIAQEVAPIFPLAITETDPTDQERPFIPDGSKVKNIGWQNDMTAYLVGAIKELKAELDAAKAKIAALEAK